MCRRFAEFLHLDLVKIEPMDIAFKQLADILDEYFCTLFKGT